MKTWLILILLLVFEVSVQAATPQLTNFNAKQFIVTPTAAPTNVIKLRLNPSQFDTNASSITITNGAGGGDTNVFNTIITTNLTVVSNLTVINNITLGGTNVAAINPTIGRYPYNQDGTNFGDGSLRYVDPMTSAVETFIVDDLAGGGVVVSEAASGIVTNLPAGTGALTNGVGGLGWFPLNGLDLWTNAAGILRPVDLALPVEIDSQINFGPGTTNIFFRNPSNILVYSNGIPVMQALDSGGRTLEWGVQSTIPFVSGTSALELFGGTGSGLVLDSGAHTIYPVTGGVGEDLGTATKYYGSLYLTNQIVFGPGTTNVVYRAGNDLVYTNGGFGATAPKLTIIDGNGLASSFQAAGGTAQVIGPGSVDLNDGTQVVRWGGTDWAPTASGKNLGANGGGLYPWEDLLLRGTSYVYGYLNLFDYSRLAVSHTGTNAWDTIRFDSQSTGIAGTAGRPFQFTNAPVMLPYVTKAEKTSLTPINGMIVYQTDNTPGLRAYVNGAWVMISTVADP